MSESQKTGKTKNMNKSQKRTDYVIRNLFFNIANNLIAMTMPFILRTVIIQYLGSEYMGLNNLCASILSVLSVAELGLSNAFVYRLYKPLAQQDENRVCQLLSFYKKTFTIIGLIIFSMGICIFPFMRYLISRNTPQGINIYIVLMLYLVNTVISYMFGSYQDLLLIAAQRYDYYFITSIISSAALYTMQIMFAVQGRYYACVAMLPIATIIKRSSSHMLVKRNFPQYLLRKRIDISTRSAIKKEIVAVAVYKIRDISRASFDNVIVSTFLGLSILSNYQNYYTVYQVPEVSMGQFSAVIAPSLGNFAVCESREKTFEVYRKNIFLYMFISGWFAIGYGFLIQKFITLWLGEAYVMNRSIAILFAIYIYMQGECLLTKMIRENAGLWSYGKKWAALEMVANLTLNIVLVQFMGVEGVILATVVTILFISIPVDNYIVYKYYFKNKIAERLKMFAANIFWLVGTTLLVAVLIHYTETGSLITDFLFRLMFCGFIPPITLAIMFYKTDEFRFFLSVIKNIGEKVKLKRSFGK